MKKLFPVFAVLVLACLLCFACVLSASAEETATPRPTPTPSPTPRPAPTAEPAFTPGPDDIVITEESGGEFRPLDLDIRAGGAPLPKGVTYSTKINIYQDPTIRVERHRGYSNYWKCNYYYMLIEIRDPSQLRTASADDTFRTSATMPVANISKRKNAVAAINGDYCLNFSGVVSNNYILRQGQVFRDTIDPQLDMLLIDEDGDFHVLTAPDTDFTAVDKTTINGKKVINAFQFGPALVIDGEKVADEIINDPKHAPGYTEAKGGAQRMCIAQIDSLHYMVLTCARHGINLCRFRDLAMTIAPCKVVYNLDGGNSAQMTLLHRKFNNIINDGKEHELRPITDIIYFASAWFTD